MSQPAGREGTSQASHVQSTIPTPTLSSLVERSLALQDTLAALSAQQIEARNALGGYTVSDDLPRPLELGHFQQLVKAECRALERVAVRQRVTLNGNPSAALDPEPVPSNGSPAPDAGEADPQVAHVLRSSNLRYLESVWAAACTKGDLIAFHRRFHFVRPEDGPKRSTLVDIVADNGLLWIKVSTITEKRMLFDLARAGWRSDSDSNSSDDEDGTGDGAKIQALVDVDNEEASLNTTTTTSSTEPKKSNGKVPGVNGSRAADDDDADDEDTDEGRSLLKTARRLQLAAKSNWVDYTHPRVVFVLPNLPEDGPASSWAADVLVKMRAEGVDVHCGPLPVCSRFTKRQPSSPLTEQNGYDQALFNRLLPDLSPILTPDVNLDCTILLALISDVSHKQLDSTAGLHPAINRQIEREHERPLLPVLLYPALAEKTLHTATEAAVRMREIVTAIGTPTEKRRAEILLGEGEGKYEDQQRCLQEWAAQSIYAAPKDLHIPVIVDRPESDETTPPPAHVATALARVRLSAVNRGVWLLGWRHGWTTVTSNRVVARQVEAAVVAELAEAEAHGSCTAPPPAAAAAEGDPAPSTQQSNDMANDPPWRCGPRVWALGTARSLVKKERGLRG